MTTKSFTDAELTAALEKGGMLQLTRATVTADIYRAAEALGFWRIAIPCAGVASRNALLSRMSDVLQFPDYFGMNLDALYDCLTDQLSNTGKKGAVLVFEGMAAMPAEARKPVLETLLDVVQTLKLKKVILTIAVS